MNYNKITLAFSEKDESLYRRQYFKDSIFQLRVALILLIALYAIYGFLDVRIFPEHAQLFLAIRFIIVIPSILLVFVLSFTKLFQKIWQALLFSILILGGTGISVMMMMEPSNNSYNIGMMLIFFSGYLFIKLRAYLATLANWIILLLFNIMAVVYSDVPTIDLLSNNFSFISANLIGMFAAYYIEFHSRRSFWLNQNLDLEKLAMVELNKNLENIVEQRTKELLSAMERVEVSNANVTAIIEGAGNSIWAFDQNSNILYINHIFKKEFYQSFGVHLETGVNIINSLPEVLKPLWRSRYDRVLAKEQFTIEDVVETLIGTRYIQVVFNPIVKKGEVVGGSCFGNDITSRKLSEIELMKAKENAEKSERLQSAFLANMSHEIRTPMNGILGFSSLLQEPNLSGKERKQYINIIEKSGRRMLNVINDIVDISKIEAGLMKLDKKASNINVQMEYIYTFFKPEAKGKNLQLTLKNSLPNEEAIIITDKEKFYAILTNLVKNALKYTSDGSIEFGYQRKDDQLEFYVKDTGIGIPIDRQHAIFERFIQADIANKMAHQGAGLGLSISKAFVLMLGGEIWLESKEGFGSTFYFTLPYHQGRPKNTQVN
ncbi:MAG: ATP-binding protein [Prolixibacteraceae bacterium]